MMLQRPLNKLFMLESVCGGGGAVDFHLVIYGKKPQQYDRLLFDDLPQGLKEACKMMPQTGSTVKDNTNQNLSLFRDDLLSHLLQKVRQFKSATC